MLKKVIFICLSLCFIFNINTMADDTINNENAPVLSQEMPVEGEEIPQRGMLKRETPPPMQGGEMPQGDFDPSKMPEGGFDGNVQNSTQSTQPEQEKGFIGFVKNYSTPVISVILLILAYVFVFFYKRKSY